MESLNDILSAQGLRLAQAGEPGFMQVVPCDGRALLVKVTTEEMCADFRAESDISELLGLNNLPEEDYTLIA